MQDFPRDAQVIMAEIVGGGLLINGGMDIDYNNCNRYQEVEKKSGKGVVGECEYIAGLRAEAETNKERLKEALVEASLGPIRGIYTREVAMQVARGELVDPLLGESLRNGKVTFKGGLLAEGISKGIAYIKNEQVKTKIKNWEIRNQEERMRMEVEGLTKGEQGQYEYVGEGRKVEPGMVWDALNQDNVGGVVEGGLGDSYKCKAGICIADDHGDDYGKTAGNKEGKWSKILVKKGDTVWGIYSNEPTSAELEEFIKQNPYIAARGVVRDADGNIKHLEIRAGEEIWVPENIATSHNNRGSNAGNTGGAAQAGERVAPGSDVGGNGGNKGLFGKYSADMGEEGGFRVYVTKEGKVVYEDGRVGQCGVLGDVRTIDNQEEGKVIGKGGKGKDISYEEFKKHVLEKGDLKSYEMSRMYGNGDPVGMGGDLGYNIKTDEGVDSYLRVQYKTYQTKGEVKVGTVGMELHNIGSVMQEVGKRNPELSRGIEEQMAQVGKITSMVFKHYEGVVEKISIDRIGKEKTEKWINIVKEKTGKVTKWVYYDVLKVDEWTAEQKSVTYGIDVVLTAIPAGMAAKQALKQTFGGTAKTITISLVVAGEKVVAESVEVGGKLKDAAKGVFTKPDTPHHKTYTDTGGHIENPYVEAMNGGTHSGWAEQYLTKPTQEIEKGIKSFEKQIKLHQEKIKNPDKYIKPNTDLREKSNLVNKKWPADIARHKELKNILEGILNERNKK